MLNIFTIGVYNSSEEEFFNKLIMNNIDLFCDIRQRRGVRGSQYKFVNSNYLQNRLKELGINYLYVKDLAPTTEIRNKQKEADKANNETKRQRQFLGIVFREEYCRQILGNFNMFEFADILKEHSVQNIAFFCVEQYASACHRSLVAKCLNNILKTTIINL